MYTGGPCGVVRSGMQVSGSVYESKSERASEVTSTCWLQVALERPAMARDVCIMGFKADTTTECAAVHVWVIR
jgi:hypothetical protein